MRKILTLWFLTVLLQAPAIAATAASSAQAPTLTPAQARQALDVLNDPKRRAQVADTLQAIAAAGALSAPQTPASAATAASGASAPTGASAASLVPAAFQSNGLASQLAREGAHWAVRLGHSLRNSVAALLDVSSVRAWWNWESTSPQARKLLLDLAWSVLGALLPALAIEWLARRLLRRVYAALAARREREDEESSADMEAATPANPASTAKPDSSKDQGAAPPLPASATAPPAAPPATPAAATRATEAKGKQNAVHHWTLLRRLPRALLSMVLRLLPLAVFVGAASALMSIITDDGTPQDRALDSLIDIYVLCRVIVIASGFFLQPHAARLRLLHMTDAWATFIQHWMVRIVTVVGIGSSLGEIGQSLGLNDAAHLALLKVVALIGHIMISILILQCQRPVAELIRARATAHRSIEMFAHALADAWAWFAVFVVMALWFVWALDVRNGYHTLLHLGGLSLLILVVARVISIVVFGALARIFNVQDDAAKNSLVHQHAYRYYPLLRRVVSWVVGVITVLALLQVWGVDVGDLFRTGSVGHRLASAIVTISVAAVLALFVWEAVNVSVEGRLDRWTTSGDLVRAARLRTLLPMLRSGLFCVIALVVVLTGLSEIGVNIGPLLAGASIFGVALGFGSQKLVQDFITGIFLLMENAMQVGDWVTLAGVSGTVEYLSIRTVRLRGGDGSLYTVPFSSVSTVNNTNRGIGNAAVKVNIVFGEDVDLAIDTLKSIGAALREDVAFKDGILSDFSFWGVDAVDGASVTLAGQIQCRDSARWGVQREFNRRILDQFQEKGIAIVNPQRNRLSWDPDSAPVKSVLPVPDKPSVPTDAETNAATETSSDSAPADDQPPVEPPPGTVPTAAPDAATGAVSGSVSTNPAIPGANSPHK